MAMSEIKIYRDLPIINSFVQVPPNQEGNKTSVDAETAMGDISGSAIVRLSGGSGRQYGSRHGQQEFLRLPGISPNEWYASDPIDAL